MSVSVIDGYRQNLREAQDYLAVTAAIKDEFKARGLIKWGRTVRGYEGWVVEGKQADDAYSNWARARCDVEHWGNLINDELRNAKHVRRAKPAPDSRLPVERDDDEVVA